MSLGTASLSVSPIDRRTVGSHAISLLDGPFRLAYNNLVRLYALITWAYSSAVEPPAHNRLVLGSIPSGPTNYNAFFSEGEPVTARHKNTTTLSRR